MAVARQGFIPSRPIDYRYVRNVAVGAGGLPVCRGDAVTRIAGLVYTATAATNPTSPLFGVVLAVYTTANRPKTHDNNKFIVSGQPGRADVCWDPTMTYFVQCVTSVGASNLGVNVMIDASAPNSRLGISAQSVDIPASASIGEHFKIIGLGPFDQLAGADSGGGANNGVEVAINRHILQTAIAAQ